MPPTDSANPLGDRTALAAANTVFWVVDAAIARGQEVWITETGASSYKLLDGGQAEFAWRLHTATMARQAQLEGVIWFPLNDNATYKTAGDILASLWA